MRKSHSFSEKDINTLVEGNNRFAFDLLHKLREWNEDNLFFRP